MSGWKLFLNNQTEPAETGWTVCTCVNEAIRVCEYFGLPNEISFDYDLGTGPSPKNYENTGAGFAQWLVDSVKQGYLDLPENFKYQVHSQHLQGKDQILDIMNRFQAELTDLGRKV